MDVLMNKKRRVKPVVQQLIMIGVTIASIFLLLGVGKEVLTMMDLKKKNAEVEVELQRLQSENANLTNQKTKLEDANYVQTYARGNYMFSKNGEQVFHLPKKDNPETTDAN